MNRNGLVIGVTFRSSIYSLVRFASVASAVAMFVITIMSVTRCAWLWKIFSVMNRFPLCVVVCGV